MEPLATKSRTPLNGKQFRNAIARDLRVEARARFWNPADEDWDEETKAEPANVGYYFAGLDFDPDDYGDEDLVFDEVPEGTSGLYPVPGVDYD